MSKAHKQKDFQEQWPLRSLLAISLAASLAAFGCTTNHNLGSGTPTRSGPEIRTAPTSGVTSGSEREAPALPPPMTSSFTTVDPPQQARSASRADAAAAIMAQHQPVRGRYLGVVNPGFASRGYVSDMRPSNRFVSPALLANPQLTINSSISSNPSSAVTSGAGDAVSTVDGTAAAIITGDATATTAPSVALPAGTFASAGATLPTVASSAIPTVTTASGVATTAPAAATTIPATTLTGTTVTTNAATAPTATATSAGAVRVVRGMDGAATVTNAPSTTGRSN